MGIILSKYITPGSRIELQKTKRYRSEDSEKNKVYASQVVDIISDDRIEISMPMEKTKLILLPVDVEYDLYFFTPNGLYQCYARVVDRYKNKNRFSLLLDLTSNLRKYQRREYYRFSCALEMNSRPLQEEEVQAIEESKVILTPELPLQRSVIVDISGGGLRFVAEYAYEVESLILCTACNMSTWIRITGKKLSNIFLMKNVKLSENKVKFSSARHHSFSVK